MHWDRENPFIFDVQVQAADIDGLGHANHSVYVKWLEACTWAHSQAMGLDLADYQRLDRGLAVVRNELDYLGSAYENDHLHVATWIIACEKNLKLTRQFQVVRPADALTLLRAQTTFVCVAISSGRPKRMPEAFLLALERGTP